jgi:hypothetical protein
MKIPERIIKFTAQADANNVIFISENPDRIIQVLQILEKSFL